MWVRGVKGGRVHSFNSESRRLGRKQTSLGQQGRDRTGLSRNRGHNQNETRVAPPYDLCLRGTRTRATLDQDPVGPTKGPEDGRHYTPYLNMGSPAVGSNTVDDRKTSHSALSRWTHVQRGDKCQVTSYEYDSD